MINRRLTIQTKGDKKGNIANKRKYKKPLFTKKHERTVYGRMNNAGERHQFQRRKQANNSRNFLHGREDERKLATDEALEKMLYKFKRR